MSYDEELKCFLPIRYIPKFPNTNRSVTYSGQSKTRRTNNDRNLKGYLTLTADKKKTKLEKNEQCNLSILSSKIQRNKHSFLPRYSYKSGKKSLLTSNGSDISQIEPLNDQNTYILRSALKSSTKFKQPNQTVKRVLFSQNSTPNSNKRLSKSNTATKTENLTIKAKLSIISESPKNKINASTQTENDSIKIDKSVQTDKLGATRLNYEVNKTPTVQETLENIKQISEDFKITIHEDMLKINDYFIDSKKKIDHELKMIEDEINNIIQNDKENITPRRSLRLSASKPKRNIFRM